MCCGGHAGGPHINTKMPAPTGVPHEQTCERRTSQNGYRSESEKYWPEDRPKVIAKKGTTAVLLPHWIACMLSCPYGMDIASFGLG